MYIMYVYYVRILAYMSWLPVTVQVCAGFLQHECIIALIQYVCVLVMVSRSTGVCACSSAVCTCVYWLWFSVSMC